MASRITVALDAMGGDQAPDIVVKGANIARARYPDARFVFFGREEVISPLLDTFPKLKDCSEIRHTDDVVEADAKPSIALRQGRASSMRKSIDAVGAGEADCAVSAGNTGALMAMAKFSLKTMPGIDRPAICGFFPTVRGESAMLDLGANIQCDARNLVQFAVMGEVFARTVLGVLKPSVGLLNVGAEELKGNDAIREAHSILTGLDLPIHYHGFIEGDDIAAGTVDVVVTDGFTGNVALKTAEGTSRLIGQFLSRTFRQSWLARLGYPLVRPAINKFKGRIDPRRHNGAMFLGLNGIVVKSHGGTDALGFANAIGVAHDIAVEGLIDKIREDLARMNASSDSQLQAAVS